VDYQDNDRDFRANAFRPEMDGPYVLQAVRACHTEHRTVVLDAQSLASALGRAVSLRGFPGMADIDTSLLLFSWDIARYARNVVSGECGDEVFGGYPWFRGDAPLDGFPWSGSLELRERLLRPEVRERLRLREYVRDTFETRRAAADPGPGWSERERRLKTMQKLCFEYFMTNLQERALRMCEGAGVRVLTPLCDERLAQYVYNVPWDMKFMGGQEKGLFRAAVADVLPESLLRRTKSPYPKTCSPQYAQILRQMALRLTMDREAPLFQLVDPAEVARIARSDLNPVDTPWFGQLMAGAQLLGYLWQINRWMRERNVTLTL
jgi:asparagine synthase (glutamine-hydrolysing)